MMVKLAADDTLPINANTNSADGWSDFLATVNRSLDPLNLELSRMRNETTGKEMYALVSNRSASVTCRKYKNCTQVNRKDDEIARIASDYSPLEISYFRALVRMLHLCLSVEANPGTRYRSNRSCLLQIAHTPSLPLQPSAR